MQQEIRAMSSSHNHAQSKSQLKIGLSKTPSTITYDMKRKVNLAKTKTLTNLQGDKKAQIHLSNEDNYDYIGDFYVGNPPQKSRGCFDTGSANAWVLSNECNTELCRLSKYNKENLYYDSDLSSSYVDLEEYATIYFGSG